MIPRAHSEAAGVGKPEHFACLWVTLFFHCKVVWSSGKGVPLCLSDPCPAPKRSFLDTDSSGKVLNPVPSSCVIQCFPSPQHSSKHLGTPARCSHHPARSLLLPS